MTSKESSPVNQHYLEQARDLVSSQVSQEHYKTYVTEERLEDVARWLEKGWGVDVYYQDAEWNWNEAGDDTTYTGLVVKPIIPEEPTA